MTNKELNALVALKMNLPRAETKHLQGAFTSSIKTELKEEKIIDLGNFGSFEINKVPGQEEISPKLKERKLIPPRLVVQFNQSTIFKAKLNLKTKNHE